ncbi:DUF4166 domain-containing protein [Gimesia algae]|uniref:DUF4166 domain-containing protein n=1 Tax=Gimesia algae TaxID=2527971 RepID=A0A517VE59_9PLAN|nr:DUF4166 domain-containing protein [Gimesia algae]QDT91285.1 hypothetical protein Pan161_29410 [Gimesia algae]
MSSIYQRVLGSDFKKLHPKIQERFGFSSQDGIASIGTGIMDELWRGRFYTVPFLYVGTWRRIMFPEHGNNIPFTIENYAYQDQFGRETVTWVRTFEGRKQRRFDAYMIFSEQRNRIVDYLGSHQHLAVDLDMSVDERGGMRIRSGAQRFYEGPLGFSFPLFFSGIADVCEWYDDDDEKYRIQVEVTNRTWGRLFGYRGSFDVVWRKTEETGIPYYIKPLREERRE